MKSTDKKWVDGIVARIVASVSHWALSPKIQIFLLSAMMLIQRLPVVKQILQFQQALSAPMAQMIRSISFTAGALGVFQAYSGASTFNETDESPSSVTIGEETTLDFWWGNFPAENPRSWRITGNIPAGMSVVGLDRFFNPTGSTLNGEILNGYAGRIEGTPTTAGEFQLDVQPFRMTNGNGETVNSGAFPITINVAEPVIALNPDSTITATGGRAQFFAQASDPQDEIKWRKDGIVLAGKTGESLLIENVNPGDVGTYQAIVDVGGGNIVASESATLSIDDNASNDMVNISTRGFVGMGDNILIGGLVITGESAKTVLIRAVGPALLKLPVNLDGKILENPQLGLYKGPKNLLTNDDWEDGGQGAALASAVNDVGALALDPGSNDSSMLVTLNPGGYTLIVTGVGNTTGIALVEAFQVD